MNIGKPSLRYAFNHMSNYKTISVFNSSNSCIRIPFRHFSTGGRKSIYSKKKNSDQINSGNTIDITESQKEFEKQNKELEKKSLEKLLNRNNINEDNRGNSNSNQNNTSQTYSDTENKFKNFNFDSFKKRNQEINTKAKSKEKESDINKKTLDKLQGYIKKDEETDGFNKFDIFSSKSSISNANLSVESKVEEDDEDGDAFGEDNNVLVHRPLKNFVWGLGEKTKQRKFKFSFGEYPTVESMVNYLEVNNLKDIIVVPTHKLGLLHLKENSILCSGFTARHIYKVAKDLVVELKKLKIPDLPFVPTVFGRRDEEWVIVEIGEIQVHFFVESFRKENDLLERWLNPAPQEYIDWLKRVDNKYYGKKKLR